MNPDVKIPEKHVQTELFLEKHVQFINTYSEKFKFEYEMVEYLRMSALYWASTALDIAGRIDLLDKEGILDFCIKSWHDTLGGFSAAPGHDPHLLYTLSAIQLAINLDLINYEKQILFENENITFEKIISFISKCQNLETGSFSGCPTWSTDIDTRFSFCAIASAFLLKKLDSSTKPFDLEKAESFLWQAQNFDGGFGTLPDSESHSGQIFCCVGALKLLNNSLSKMPKRKQSLLSHWLAERQLKHSGGLNGRPEKLPDVCYSFWVLSSLKMLGHVDWIDGQKLTKFILAAQDSEDGGIGDRPGDWMDPFHTLFGLAGLSMLGYQEKKIEEDKSSVVHD